MYERKVLICLLENAEKFERKFMKLYEFLIRKVFYFACDVVKKWKWKYLAIRANGSWAWRAKSLKPIKRSEDNYAELMRIFENKYRRPQTLPPPSIFVRFFRKIFASMIMFTERSFDFIELLSAQVEANDRWLGGPKREKRGNEFSHFRL